MTSTPQIDSLLRWLTSASGLIAGIALAVATASFVLFRERYHGACVFPNDDTTEFAIFWLFPLLFLFAFVVLVSVVTRPLLSTPALRPAQAWLLSIGLALTTYALIGFVVWLTNPVPIGVDWGEPIERALYSALWPIGLLVETGNFGRYACGQ